MPTISYNDRQFPLAPNETVLDALTRNDVAVPHSCKAGACQSCLVRATAGAAPAHAQQGLKPSLRAQGYFLACQAKPTADLTVAPADGVLTRAPAVVRRVDKLGANVARVILKCDANFDYRPGQFLHLVRPADGLSRSYSLASFGPDRHDHLELHVRKIAGGAMSTWLHDDVAPGESVEIHGPAGDCFYTPGQPDQPLLLVGTGTGLAPLYAIAHDALHQGHTGPIHLYHGAVDANGLYHVDELRALAAQYPNVAYVPCVMNATDPQDASLRVGDLQQTVLADHPKLAGFRIFLCGHPTLVQSLRKRCFLAGAKMKDISSDAFVPTPARA
jgi:NAD(P)H-flavin reductase/ferredoxin